MKRYALICSGTASRSWRVLPRPGCARLPIVNLNEPCLRVVSKFQAPGRVCAGAETTRSYATATEVASRLHGDRPTVNLDLTSKDGHVTTIEIRPSYPHKPKAIENLLASLPELLTDAGMPLNAITSFATEGWDLDEYGDAIHRYVEVTSEQDIASVLDYIAAAAQELKHDPHIHSDGKQLTISCTTHLPPGLSMKDVKLARRINDILREAGMVTASHASEADILTQRQRGREHNMEAIRKAKLDCNCG